MNNLNHGVHHTTPYRVISVILLVVLAFLFLFPLYWIVTGSFKNARDINSASPAWWPSEWVTTNYEKLFSRRTAPLFEFDIPTGISVTKTEAAPAAEETETAEEAEAAEEAAPAEESAGKTHIAINTKKITGPVVPAAIRWLVNTVWMAVASMILTCITATMAGYALAKKRFLGRGLIFTVIVCAMALPKQVILIPLIREMSSLDLYNTLWAVILPIVGWPFGVFLMKQFSEGIPGEMLEAARIDGASEAKTFMRIVVPLVKPGIGALAIFTFINSWNDYFMQLIMLTSTGNLTISLGIAQLQAELSTDYGLIMAGAALAAVPILTVFIIFQKYFTQGITMGAVKG